MRLPPRASCDERIISPTPSSNPVTPPIRSSAAAGGADAESIGPALRDRDAPRTYFEFKYRDGIAFPGYSLSQYSVTMYQRLPSLNN